jgi:hypothetical protein
MRKHSTIVWVVRNLQHNPAQNSDSFLSCPLFGGQLLGRQEKEREGERKRERERERERERKRERRLRKCDSE